MRRLLCAAVTVAVAVAIPLPAFADVSGTVMGTVRDATTGTPLAGVCVVATGPDTAATSTTTSAMGTYTLQLDPYTYHIEFYGCTPATSDYLNEAFHDHLTGTGDPVDVGSGAVVTGIDADMQHAASISGTVVDAATHAPVSGVQVNVVAATNDGNNENNTQPLTDNAGHYTVGHLAPGSYEVFFFKSPYLQTPYPSEPYGATPTHVPVSAGQAKSGIDVQLHHGTLSGQVTDSNGNPVVGDEVVAEPVALPHYELTTSTDANGHYLLQGVAPGAWRLHFSGTESAGSPGYPQYYNCRYDAQYFGGTADETSSTQVQVALDSDVALDRTTLLPPGTMTVHVVDATGAPLPGASVDVSAGGPSNDPFESNCQPGQLAGQTGPTGTISGTLAHGLNTIYVQAPGFFDWYSESTLDSESTRDVTVTMQRPATIEGTVTDNAGHPLAGVAVHGGQPPGPSDGHYYQEWDATTDANGHWQNTMVHAGKWRVTYTDMGTSRAGGAYPPRYYPSTFSFPTTVTAGDGEHVVLDNETLLRGSRVAGHLSTAEGSPAPDYTQVVLQQADAQGRAAAEMNPDANGDFSLGPVDPGSYRLEFTNDSPYATSWYRGASDATSATVLALTDSQTYTANDALHYAPGQAPPGAPPPEPTVAITGGPTAYSGRTAAFSFTSTNTVKTTCALDGAAQTPCTSPVTYNGLYSGNHQVTVIAVNSAGHAAMATRSWKTDVDAPGVYPGLWLNINFTLARTVRFPYSAKDIGAGLASYDVRYRTGAWNAGLSAWHYPSAWQHTTSTSVLTVLSRGQTICVSVRARDVVGNVAPWSKQQCRARALDDRALSTVTTGWHRGRDSRDYGATYTKALRRGVKLALPATRSDQVALVAMACPTCGSVDVLVAGHLIATVDLTSARVYRHLLVRLNPYLPRYGRIVVRAHSGYPVIDGLAVSHDLFRYL